MSLERAIEEVRELVKCLAKHGLKALIIFGSIARGDALKESDLDVLVIAEGFRNKPFYEREYMVLKCWRGEHALEPWCYTPEEVERAISKKPRIDIVDALEHGIVVYDDGTWERLRKAYMRRKLKRTWYGGVKLQPTQDSRADS